MPRGHVPLTRAPKVLLSLQAARTKDTGFWRPAQPADTHGRCMPGLTCGDHVRQQGQSLQGAHWRAGFGSPLAKHRKTASQLPITWQRCPSVYQERGLPVLHSPHPCEPRRTSPVSPCKAPVAVGSGGIKMCVYPLQKKDQNPYLIQIKWLNKFSLNLERDLYPTNYLAKKALYGN